MNAWKRSIISVSFLALSTGWAVAAPAVVLDYLNLRAGPGYDNYIIEVIPAGWIINAGGCADGWCQVNVNGIIGFRHGPIRTTPTTMGTMAPRTSGLPRTSAPTAALMRKAATRT